MTSENDLTIDAARLIARQAGLTLTDDELQDLLTGIKRTRMMAQAGRTLLRSELEPSPRFTATTVRS
jgi:hypothetical protein